MEKIKITPEVVMKNTVIGKYYTDRLHNYIVSVVALLTSWCVAVYLTSNYIIPNWFETLICVLIVVNTILLLIKSKSVILGYYSINYYVNNCLIIEKRQIERIVTPVVNGARQESVVEIRDQQPLNGYLLDTSTIADYQSSPDVYTLDIETSTQRIGLGVLPTSKYTI